MGVWSTAVALKNTAASACSLVGTPTISVNTADGSHPRITLEPSSTELFGPIVSGATSVIPSEPVVVQPGSSGYFYIVSLTRSQTDKTCEQVPENLDVTLASGTATLEQFGLPACGGTEADLSPFTLLAPPN
jgi:uncharacterized protein DUF4232